MPIRRIVPMLVILNALAACSGWAETHTSDSATSLVISAERTAAPEGVRAWTVEYVSQTIHGAPTTVTGWIAIPEVQKSMPILAWAHPTAGLADICAPSRQGGRTPFDFGPELEAGWAVVATDYEGLGGPGLHPYLVGESEARSIFDIARAARELDGRVGTDLMLWGFSQGGHAVLSAAASAPDLAPDFDVIGTAAIAPVVDLRGWPPAALGTSQQGYIVAIVTAYAETYGLDLSDVLTPIAIELIDELETSCANPTSYGVSQLTAGGAFVVDPSQSEPWATLLTDNSPEFMTIDSPVLLVLGDEDELWDVSRLPLVLDRMCAAGTPVASAIFVGEGHQSVTGAARGTVHGFLVERVGQQEFVSDC